MTKGMTRLSYGSPTEPWRPSDPDRKVAALREAQLLPLSADRRSAAPDRESEGKASNLARRPAQGMSVPVRAARCGARCSPTGARALALIEAGQLGSAREGGVAALSSSSDRRRPSAKTSRSGHRRGPIIHRPPPWKRATKHGQRDTNWVHDRPCQRVRCWTAGCGRSPRPSP
jgi:hypothetical protein